jgi:hypothetical protein
MPLFMSENTTFESVLYSCCIEIALYIKTSATPAKKGNESDPDSYSDHFTACCMVIGLLKALHFVSDLCDH